MNMYQKPYDADGTASILLSVGTVLAINLGHIFAVHFPICGAMGRDQFWCPSSGATLV